MAGTEEDFYRSFNERGGDVAAPHKTSLAKIFKGRDRMRMGFSLRHFDAILTAAEEDNLEDG